MNCTEAGANEADGRTAKRLVKRPRRDGSSARGDREAVGEAAAQLDELPLQFEFLWPLSLITELGATPVGCTKGSIRKETEGAGHQRWEFDIGRNGKTPMVRTWQEIPGGRKRSEF